MFCSRKTDRIRLLFPSQKQVWTEITTLYKIQITRNSQRIGKNCFRNSTTPNKFNTEKNGELKLLGIFKIKAEKPTRILSEKQKFGWICRKWTTQQHNADSFKKNVLKFNTENNKAHNTVYSLLLMKFLIQVLSKFAIFGF